MKQQSFVKTNWNHRFCHGGNLRNQRAGRSARPLAAKEPLHIVLKINPGVLKGGLRGAASLLLINKLLKRYAKKFFVRIDRFSINADHIHIVLRFTKRSLIQAFFRVVPGQFAQRMGIRKPSRKSEAPLSKRRLWKNRPWSRVIKGYRAYRTALNYVQLNIKEAEAKIIYQKNRTRGFSTEELGELWG